LAYIVISLNVHLESNRENGQVPKEIGLAEIEEKVTAGDMVGLVKHYQKFSALRAEQAKAIQKHSQSAAFPVVIAGDFNDTAQSYVYQLIGSDMEDAFISRGNGIGVTYGGRIPALRIDHLFVRGSEALSHNISRNPYSDHYLVWSRFNLD